MIVNVYPSGNQQPTPKFVEYFYKDLRKFLIENKGTHASVDDAVAELMELHNLSASISLQTVTFEDYEPDNEYPYIIFGWENIIDQWRFVMFYDAESAHHILRH